MKTTLIKTTGRPMTAACFGMPAAALSFVAPAIPGFGGLEGSDLSALWTITRGAGIPSDPSALVAAVGANRGYVYAAGAGNHQQVLAQNSKKSQHHAERTFRGPEPWRERT
ncbi:hypothetical protein ACEZCY_23625 [Streptacidiphilus sp. N1-12]|uniref:Uncharacterized protein n=2 Tax=Streptacidiphilus alkalitolerans TaxID=3342712 RepID=A0ABV6VEC4_9ACTN